MVRAAIVAAILLTSSVAAADDIWFVRGGVGAGRFRARQPAASGTILGSITQTGFGAEISVGGRIGRFVVAGTLLEHIVTFDDAWGATHPLAEGTSFTLATLGTSVEYHPVRRGGPFIGGTLGLVEFANGTDERPLGIGVALHGGFDIPWSDRSSLGLALRLHYASMHTDDYGGSRVQTFSPMFMLQYAYR